MNKRNLSVAILLATIAAATTCFMSKRPAAEINQLVLANVEALGDCEVRDSRGELIVRCQGESGICREMYTGNGYIYCPGTRVE